MARQALVMLMLLLSSLMTLPTSARADAPADAQMRITELDHDKDAPSQFAIELRRAEVGDVFRLLAHDYHLNLVIDEQVRGTVTASLTNVSLQEALEAIAEMNHLILIPQGNLLKVSRNLLTRTFLLQHVEAEALLDTSSATEAAAVGDRAPNTIYDLLSADGKVLLGRQPNSIMVIDYPEVMEQIDAFLAVADQRMASQAFRLKYLNAAELVGQGPESAGEAATAGTASE